MNAKSIALVITFSGLTIILNPAVSGLAIPYPPLPTFLAFNVWEIPLIVVFLLFGFKVGLTVAGINALFAFAIFPGPSNPFLALGTLVTALSMMTGLYIMYKVIGRKANPETLGKRAKLIVLATLSASLLRILFQGSWTFLLLRSPIYHAPDAFIFTIWLPWQAIFNILQPIITIPLAFIIARSVSKNIKVTSESSFSSMLA